MELAKAYFEEFGRPLIEGPLSPYKKYIAAGLVGEGSECMGFDDELSQDHDFGPAFCLWVPEAILRQAGNALQAAYDTMPTSYRGYTRITSAQGGGRVGVLSTEGFYRKFTGLDHAPQDNLEWFRIPERFLATASNGEVFLDYYGTFSEIRCQLKSFYPEDVQRKKMAARCAVMAQAGQYNYGRSMKRGDSQAAYFACAEFVKNAMSCIYLLNETYMPYYKWIFRGAQGFRIMRDTVGKLEELTMISDAPAGRSRKEWLIEDVCTDFCREFNRRGMTRTMDTFLQAHGEELMRSIRDTRLRNLHIMADHD